MIDSDSMKIYHITHIRNLSSMIEVGQLRSDAKRLELGLNCSLVGITDIKNRRLELPVSCQPGTMVGEYVPFYFCPRSIMLYLLFMGNHPNLDYHDGQQPIIHLQADTHKTVKWAENNNVRWAFSTSNAGARYTQFYNDTDAFEQIDWDAVHNKVFRDPLVKEGKQAEFLVYEAFPWELIEKIGVIDERHEQEVNDFLEKCAHKPLVQVERDWYY